MLIVQGASTHGRVLEARLFTWLNIFDMSPYRKQTVWCASCACSIAPRRVTHASQSLNVDNPRLCHAESPAVVPRAVCFLARTGSN